MSGSVVYEFASFDSSRKDAEISNVGFVNLTDSRYSNVGLGHTHVSMQTYWEEMPENYSMTNLHSSDGHDSDCKQ